MTKNAIPLTFRVSEGDRELIITTARKSGYKSTSKFLRHTVLWQCRGQSESLTASEFTDLYIKYWDLKYIVATALEIENYDGLYKLFDDLDDLMFKIGPIES